jgi:preprotein translocase subunit YajC
MPADSPLTPFDLLLFALVAVMVFFIFGQNRKRRREAEALMRSVEVGDKVVLASGIVGKVTEVQDEEITIVSAGSKMLVLKAAVRSRKPAGEN